MRVVSNPRRRTSESLLPSSALLERARDLVARHADAGLVEVALVRSPRLSSANRRVWLALESLQTTGSFKVRGALLALEAEIERGCSTFVAASAGNHGIGVSFAAKRLGVSATVVVPRGTPRNKLDKIAFYGATIVESSEHGYDGAEKEALARAKESGAHFVSPYDDDAVIAGNGGSLGLEIARKLGRDPDVVVCPIGGGGLATGLGSVLRSRVVVVQSEASCAFAKSVESGAAVVELPPAETLAEGLEGGISERAFDRACAVVDAAVVIAEDAIAHAMNVAFRDVGLVLEGSAAVALAPLIESLDFEASGDVVVVLSGRNVDPERAARVLDRAR